MSTLSQLIDAVELELADSSNAKWSTAELTSHIRQALRVWSAVSPLRQTHTVTLASAGREVDLSGVTNLGYILDVWFPYDPDDPLYPPRRPAWSRPDADVIRLEVLDEPAAGDQLRLLTVGDHTISGLDSAATTTLDGDGEQVVILAAASYAATQRAQRLIGTVTAHPQVPQQLLAWAAIKKEHLEALLASARRRAISNKDARIAWVQP